MADESSSSPESVPSCTTGGHFRWEPPSAAELQELMPGYTIEKLLGRGGMGAVYRGVQTNLDRPVAIKILPPGIEKEDPSFVERFKSEARLMAKLNHPGVVAVYDFGTTSAGQLYFAMEYVDGSDVSQLIHEKGRLPPEHALAITAHMCDALGAAHELGIVHRDIKPANILINMKGQVKVADFGLAKIEDPGQHGLTKTGYAMGTPDFVSPEALMLGSHIDGRADLYAVGVMLYQMLTGNVPRGAFKPASVLRSTLDPRYDPIITKAMQHDREDRYQNAAELRRDLDVILTTPYVRPEETSAVAAVPPPQVEAVRTAPPQRRVPQPVRKTPQQTHQPALQRPGHGKSQSGLWLGIGAIVLVLGGLAYLLMEPAKPKAKSNPVTPQAQKSSAPVVAPKTHTPTPATTAKNASAPEQATSASLPTITGWQDMMAAAKDAIPKLGQTGVKEEDGWLIATGYKGPATALLEKKDYRDVAMRARIRGWVNLNLRISREPNGYYSARFPRGADGGLKLVTDGSVSKTPPLATFPPNAAPEHDILFTITGPDLRVWVDGQLVATAHDTTITSGASGIALAEDGAAFRDLAIAELSADFFAKAQSAAVANLDEKWIDGLAEWWKTNPDGVGGPDHFQHLKRESNGSRVMHSNAVLIATKTQPPARNVAVRATASESDRGGWTLAIRSSAYTKYMARIQAKGNKTDASILFVDSQKPGVELARADLPAGFDLTRVHTCEFSAQGETLTLIVDGEHSVVARDSRLITGDGNFPSAAGKAYFSSAPGALLEKLEYRELPDVSQSAAAPAASGEQWKDWLAEWWANPAKAKIGSFIKEAGGTRFSDKQKTAGVGKFRDVAVRVTARGTSDKAFWGLMLRANIVGVRRCYYITPHGPPGRGELRLETGEAAGVVKILHRWDLPLGYSRTDAHTLEARIQGDRIIGILDGQQVVDIRDATISEVGGVNVQGDEEVLLEKLEYCEMAPQAAAAPAVAGEQWVDALAAKKIAAPVVLGAKGNGPLFGPGEHRDLSVRATVSGAGEGSRQLFLRASGPTQGDRYVAGWGRDKKAALQVFQNGQPSKFLALSDLPAGFDPNARHSAEFSAQGSTFILRINGQEIVRAEDSTLPSGATAFYGGPPGSLIEKLEYRELSSSAAAPGDHK